MINELLIPVEGRTEKFNLSKYLDSKGLELQEQKGVSWNNPLYKDKKEGMKFIVKNKKTGKKEDFDAISMLESKGYQVDARGTRDEIERFEKQTSLNLKEAKAEAHREKIKKDLESFAGMSDQEISQRMFSPGTMKLFEEKAKKGEKPGVFRGLLAAAGDALSFPVRTTMAGAEAIVHLTGGVDLPFGLGEIQGQPFSTSMMDLPEYGVDEQHKDKSTLEALQAHMVDLKEAFKEDPSGVVRDLARESVRDPLTVAAIIAAQTVPVLGQWAAAGRLGQVAASVAQKAKVAKALKQTKRAAEGVKRFQQRSGQIAKNAAKFTAVEGLGGGAQGVLLKWAYGSDNVTWADFAVEAAEEATIGAAIRGGSTSVSKMLGVAKGQWENASKSERSAVLHKFKKDADQVKASEEAGVAQQRYEKAKVLESNPEAYAQSEAFSELMGEVQQIPAFTPEQTAIFEARMSTPPSLTNKPVKDTPVEFEAISGAQTIVKKGDEEIVVDITQPLPDGVSRKQAIEAHYNPGMNNRAQQANSRFQSQTKQEISKDLKDLRKKHSDYENEVVKPSQELVNQIETELKKEEADEAKATDKEIKEIQTAAQNLIDPTKLTSFSDFQKTAGSHIDDAQVLAKAFEDFHVDEQKKIKALKERISPTQEGGVTPGVKVKESSSSKSGVLSSKKKESPGGMSITTTAESVAEAEKAKTMFADEGKKPEDLDPDEDVVNVASTPAEGDNSVLDVAAAGLADFTEGDRVDIETQEVTDGQEQSDIRDGAGAVPASPEVSAETDVGDIGPTVDGQEASGAGDNPGNLERDAVEQGDEPELNRRNPELYTNIDLNGKDPVELTPAKRRQANKDAIEILEEIKKDPTNVTPEMRDALRKYTGIGGIDADVSADEQHGMRYQYYTSYILSKGIWDILSSIGYKDTKGKVAFEPAAGIGNIMGFAPRDIKWMANEVDQTSSDIQKILYPRSENKTGPFETWNGQKADIVATNVPFQKGRGRFAYLETDKTYQPIKSLHNYFIAKGVDNLRDNGVGIFITSTSTLDAKTAKAFREDLNLKAEVIAALRLPEGAFSKNAQFKGSSDLIIVRKRTHGEMEKPASERIQPEFVNTKEVTSKGEKTSMTKWFDEHPDQVLGTLEFDTGFRPGIISASLSVGKEGFNAALKSQLDMAASKLEGSYKPQPGAQEEIVSESFGESVGAASNDTPINGYEVKGGKVYKKLDDGKLYPFREHKEKYSIPDKAFLLITEIMERIQKLDAAFNEGRDVSLLQEEIKERLNEYKGLGYTRQPKLKNKHLYPGVSRKRHTIVVDGKRKFVDAGLKAEHPALDAYFENDFRYWQLPKLYDNNLDGFSRFLNESSLMSKPPKVTKGDLKTASGVVDYVMKKYGRFEDPIARQTWEGEPGAYEGAMRSHPQISFDGESFVHDDEFLTGDLNPKIQNSRKLGLEDQVKKLEKYLPTQKTIETLDYTPKSTFWDSKAITSFAQDELGVSSNSVIKREEDATGKKEYAVYSAGVKKDFGDMIDSPEIDRFVNSVLNPYPLRKKVEDIGPDGQARTRNVDDPVTTAQFKKKMQDKFKAWGQSEKGIEHSKRALEDYNQKYMGKSTKEISGDNLFIEGISKGVDFYPSQYQAVRMALQNNGYLLAHNVGYGKTLAAILTYVSMKNAGRINKAVFVVPGNTLVMWKNNFDEFAPNIKAKLIRGDKAKSRTADIQDAAINDYDVVLISQDSFQTVPLRKAYDYTKADIDKFTAMLKEYERTKAKESGKKTNTEAFKKRMENKIDKLTNKLGEISQRNEDPRVIKLEDWGVDAIFADEAHEFKNYYEPMFEYADNHNLNITQDSNVGNDFYYKTKAIHERNGGQGGVYLLTGTPTPNKAIEIYKMLKLIAPKKLEEIGIESLDDFIRDFAELGSVDTAGIAGVGGKVVNDKLVGFRNAKALRDLISTYVDVKLKEHPVISKLRPDHSEKIVSVPMSDAQMNEMAQIISISMMSIDGMRKLGHSPLTLSTIAQGIALDPAKVNPSLIDEIPSPFDRSPKLKQVMDDVKRFYEKNNRLQLVFLDNYNIYRTEHIVPNEKTLWPAGFGYSENLSGQFTPPGWMIRSNFTTEQSAQLEKLMNQPNADQSFFPRNNKGEPIDFKKNKGKYRPIFEGGNVYLGVRRVAQNLHEEIKKFAINEIGIPSDRIEIVNGNRNNSPMDKGVIERRVFNGDFNLLIGNREAMGQGMNLQTGGDAIHQVDAVWNPKGITQGNGRFLRARKDVNDKHPVSIQYYMTEGSLDNKMYEVTGEKKQWQEEVWVGEGDNIDLRLDGDSDGGVNFKEFAKDNRLPKSYIEGAQIFTKVLEDETKIQAATKELNKVNRDIERQDTKINEHKEYINRAEKRIKAREEKYALEQDKGEGAAEPDHSSDNETIERHQRDIADISESRIKNLDKLGTLKDVPAFSHSNKIAKEMVKDVRSNKWKTLTYFDDNKKDVTEDMLSSQVDAVKTSNEALDNQKKEFDEFLKATIPGISTMYPSLLGMVYRKVVGNKPKTDLETAKKLQDYADKKSKNVNSQSGKADWRVLMGGAAIFTSILTGSPTPVLAAAIGGLAYAGRGKIKDWGSGFNDKVLTSIEARLEQMKGFSAIQPKFRFARNKVKNVIGKMLNGHDHFIQKLTEDEISRIPGILEGLDDADGASSDLLTTVKFYKRLFAEVAEFAEMKVDPKYYPRVVDFEMIQEIQNDPDLEKAAVDFIVDQGYTQEEAYAIIASYYDGSEEMKIKRRQKQRKEFIESLIEKSGGNGEVFSALYNRMKSRFRGETFGHFMGRKAPRLPDQFYKRDVRDVIPNYVRGAVRNIVYKEAFGEGMADINSFLDSNFGFHQEEERGQVEDWIYSELYGRRLQGAGILTPEQAAKATGAQFHLKLSYNPASPVRNIGNTAGWIITLGGVRTALQAAAKTFKDMATGKGWSPAVAAGAISEQTAFEVVEMMENKKDYVKGKKWKRILRGGLFVPSEKLSALMGYNAGEFRANRLFSESLDGNTKSMDELIEIIGQNEYDIAMENGRLLDHQVERVAIDFADEVRGLPRTFNVPAWSNTPEGVVLWQYRRTATVLTKTLKDKVFKPALRGDVKPLIRWAASIGMTAPITYALLSVIQFWKDDDSDDADTIMGQAWNAMEFLTHFQYLNMYGDLMLGLESGDEFGEAPLVGTLAGPTAGTVLRTGKAAVHGVRDDNLDERLFHLLKQEVPVIRYTTKAME